MTFFEILLEGSSDVPAVRGILERRFGWREDEHFRLHPHRGKGRLPANPLARPGLNNRGLLDQLPAKLRGYGHFGEEYCVVVLVDADREDCRDLKKQLVDLYEKLPSKPSRVLFRIAVEETESWFLADQQAIRAAYPKCRLSGIRDLDPDQVCGAWEHLAAALGHGASGSRKNEWARKITPHLDIENPKSPSLRAFLDGVGRMAEIEN